VVLVVLVARDTTRALVAPAVLLQLLQREQAVPLAVLEVRVVLAAQVPLLLVVRVEPRL
jgi:hypothetical protein